MSDRAVVYASISTFLRLTVDEVSEDKDGLVLPKDPREWTAELNNSVVDAGDICIGVDVNDDADGNTLVYFGPSSWKGSSRSTKDRLLNNEVFGFILKKENLQKLAAMFKFAAEQCSSE